MLKNSRRAITLNMGKLKIDYNFLNVCKAMWYYTNLYCYVVMILFLIEPYSFIHLEFFLFFIDLLIVLHFKVSANIALELSRNYHIQKLRFFLKLDCYEHNEVISIMYKKFSSKICLDFILIENFERN